MLNKITKQILLKKFHAQVPVKPLHSRFNLHEIYSKNWRSHMRNICLVWINHTSRIFHNVITLTRRKFLRILVEAHENFNSSFSYRYLSQRLLLTLAKKRIYRNKANIKFGITTSLFYCSLVSTQQNISNWNVSNYLKTFKNKPLRRVFDAIFMVCSFWCFVKKP